MKPSGELTIRTLAMPAYTNANGDIFGGWLVSQMDLAGASMAMGKSHSRVVTVAIESMSFISPVKVGDFVCCYAEILKIGRTSMQIQVQAWVVRMGHFTPQQVTKGVFTFVCVNEQGRPIPINS
jgi:acyl-CoA thioesterase YciA